MPGVASVEMGAAHTMPGAQQPGPDVVQIRRRSADELQHLNSGYLRVSLCGGGRVKITEKQNMGSRLLEDLIAMHELLLILSDEELYWVELESRRRFDFHNIGPPHLSRLVDPVFDDHLENQLRQWYGQHYEDRLARRIKSSVVFGWCVSPTERIFSSFIFAHEVVTFPGAFARLFHGEKTHVLRLHATPLALVCMLLMCPRRVMQLEIVRSCLRALPFCMCAARASGVSRKWSWPALNFRSAH